jgi:ABC-type anion transport system duplicated permease subunit
MKVAVLAVLVGVLVYVVVRSDRFIVGPSHFEQEMECMRNSNLAVRVDTLRELRDQKLRGWIKSYTDEMRQLNQARCPCDRDEETR